MELVHDHSSANCPVSLSKITHFPFVSALSGLQKYLNQLGFHIVGYGCTTCIGNSGDIDESVAAAISENGNSIR